MIAPTTPDSPDTLATTSRSTRLRSDLDPVRAALLDDARHAASDIVRAASADADQTVAAARHDTDEALERVRRRAEATARARAERAQEDARRAANTELLRTRDALQREVADRIRDAVSRLPDDPRYPALLDRLEQLARQQLGPDAEIVPDPDGGLVATAGGRRVDYRLPALADRASDAIADEVVTLWS